MIEDVFKIKGLKSLNLAANEIRLIPDLSALKSLARLNLSGNRIISMVNLKFLAQASPALEFLDLSDNRLGNLKELRILEAFPRLATANFHLSSDESNPFCADLGVYYSEVLLLRLAEGCKVDGMRLGEILARQRSLLLPKEDRGNQEAAPAPAPRPPTGQSIRPVQTPVPFPPENSEPTTKKNPISNSKGPLPPVARSLQPNQFEEELAPQGVGLTFPTSNNFGEPTPTILQGLNKRLSDSKTNPFNLEKKVVELTDLLEFKERTFRQREEKLTAQVADSQRETQEVAARLSEAKQKIFSLEKENRSLESSLEEARKAASGSQNLWDKLHAAQEEGFKLQNQVDKMLTKIATSEEESRGLREALSRAELAADTLRGQLEASGKETQELRVRLTNIEVGWTEKELRWQHKAEEANAKIAELTMDNARLKGLESQAKAVANVAGELEKLELRKQLAAENAALTERISQIQSSFEKEKSEMNIGFQENLMKLEGDFTKLVREIAEKNSELKREVSGSKSQVVG